MEKQHIAITSDSIGGQDEVTEAVILKDSNCVNEPIMYIESIVKVKNESPKPTVKLNVNEPSKRIIRKPERLNL